MIDKNDSRERAPQRGDGEAGEYRLLYKYLRDRFSDRLLLTFGQIEDLLGFSLPVAARVEAREHYAATGGRVLEDVMQQVHHRGCMSLCRTAQPRAVLSASMN